MSTPTLQDRITNLRTQIDTNSISPAMLADILDGLNTLASGISADAVSALRSDLNDAKEILQGNIDMHVHDTNADVAVLSGDIASLSARISAILTDAEQALSTAQIAANTANTATQSVSAATSLANTANDTARALSVKVEALEASSPFEKLASEEEWQVRKAAGTLNPNKLYFVAES